MKLRNSSISTQLNALLKQMVEMEMSKRPQSMTLVRQQLQQLLAQQTAHLHQTQTNSTNKVGRRSVLLGSVSTVAACSAITVYIFKNGLNLFSTAHRWNLAGLECHQQLMIYTTEQVGKYDSE